MPSLSQPGIIDTMLIYNNLEVVIAQFLIE